MQSAFYNPNCVIYNSSDTIYSKATIYGYANSSAQSYAEKYNRNFVLLDEHEHTYSSVVTKEPTCLEEGVRTYTCTAEDCAESYTEAIPALGHSLVKLSAKAATCTETGLTAGEYCTRCDYKVEQTVIAKKDHTVVTDKAVAATCKATGLTEGKHCSVCAAVIVKQEVVPMREHNVVIDPSKEATCTESGYTEGKHCADCGTILVPRNTVPAKGHGDNDGDGKCDSCGTVLNPSKDCSHICHKTGFMGFIYKIIRIFWKLFRIHQTCECGVKHY